MRLLKLIAALFAGLFLLSCSLLVVAGCSDKQADAAFQPPWDELSSEVHVWSSSPRRHVPPETVSPLFLPPVT